MGAAHGSDLFSRRLRRRFILAASGAFSVALLIICITINLWNYHLIGQRADAMLDLIHGSGEVPSEPPQSGSSAATDLRITAETPFQTRYFTVRLSQSGSLETLDASHVAAIGDSEMVSMAREALEGGRSRGFFHGSYRFAVYEEEGESLSVVVLDCSGDIEALELFLTVSIGVCGACALIALALLLPLSRLVVRPFAANQERQRRFVTDASHELKTPVAIIAANNDLIEQTGGQNQWTESTRTQIRRASALISDLVELARADESPDATPRAPVNLSSVTVGARDAFVPLAEAGGKELDCEVEDGLSVMGDAAELERLLGILLDNAIKYCEGSGPIRVVLDDVRRRTGRGARLVVSNPCTNLSAEDVEHVFDRFYRADASRSTGTGGHGIGLALARAIVRRHGGDIRAQLGEGVVSFVVTLPLARA